jgi:alginate O-acetyltransferase complex protein AlgJ
MSASAPASARTPTRAAFGFIFATALMNAVSFGVVLPVLPNLIKAFAHGEVGREVYSVRRQAEGQSLIDDAPAPVHVTGHSMVQPYFGFPQKLSNLIDRPVSVNWKPGNVGQWIMLLEYVESPEFKAHEPQVLIWQMFEPTYAQGPDASGLWYNASIMSTETWLSRLKAALGT